MRRRLAAHPCVHENRRPGEDGVTLDGSIVGFIGIAALLTILPGADMALVAKVTLLDGRRAAFFTSLGICAGLPVHATASALGLSLVIATSAEAFTVVKFAGAAYLALPQFISPGDNVLAKSLLLAGIHAVLGLAWLPLYAYAIDRIGAVIRGARRWLERVSGAALIGLGVRLALERR